MPDQFLREVLDAVRKLPIVDFKPPLGHDDLVAPVRILVAERVQLLAHADGVLQGSGRRRAKPLIDFHPHVRRREQIQAPPIGRHVLALIQVLHIRRRLRAHAQKPRPAVLEVGHGGTIARLRPAVAAVDAVDLVPQLVEQPPNQLLVGAALLNMEVRQIGGDAVPTITPVPPAGRGQVECTVKQSMRLAHQPFGIMADDKVFMALYVQQLQIRLNSVVFGTKLSDQFNRPLLETLAPRFKVFEQITIPLGLVEFLRCLRGIEHDGNQVGRLRAKAPRRRIGKPEKKDCVHVE